MEKRSAKRTRKRIACEFACDGRRHSGIVLDLSATGIFIQTTATLRPGDRLELTLNDDQPIAISGTVARRMVVPANLSLVAKGGIGVELIRPPAAYHALFERMSGPSSERPASRGGTHSEKKRGRKKASPPPAADRKRFRVLVSPESGGGNRAYVMDCASEDEARERALRAAGDGWTVSAVEDA